MLNRQNKDTKKQQIIPQQIEASDRQWLLYEMKLIEQKVSIQSSDLIQKGQFMRNKKLKKDLSLSDESNSCNFGRRLSEIRRQQIALRQKLRDVVLQQKNTKQKSIYQKKTQISKPLSNKALKALTRKYREFKLQLQQKTKFIQLQEEQSKHKINALNQQKKMTQCNQRKKQIQLKLKKMEERRNKRAQLLKEQKNRLKSLKKKKLYQRMAEDYNSFQNLLLNEKYQQYEKKKQRVTVNMQQLKQHERYYDRILGQKQQERKNKLQESRIILPNINPYRSRFYDNILKEQQIVKQQKQNAKQMAKNLRQKHKQYEQMILRQHAPNVIIKQPESRIVKISLSRDQIKNLGNLYYSAGQTRIKPPQSRVILHSQTQNSSVKKYENYLPEILKGKSVSQTKYNLKKNYLKRVNHIMKDEGLSQGQKLQQIKLFIGQIYGYDQNQNADDNMIEKLRAKINVLSLIQ